MGEQQRVVVIGQGYVGLPVAVRAAEVGFDVVGLDLDEDRVKGLKAGVSHIEDIGDDRLQAVIDLGRYRASSDYADAAGFDVAVISVPTPLREGVPDLSYIESSARSLAPHLREGATVILESTTYPGTTEELVGPILEDGSGLAAGTQFHLGYSPERIDPGNTTWTLETTPKIVSGVDDASLAAVTAFFDRLCDTTVPVPGCKEAELTKLIENTFRHVNIALVNELAMFANDLGIDVWESIDAASTKPFGFMRFTPGPGVGGHCLPVDPSFLSWRVKRSLGHDFRFVELANDINEHMPDFVVRRLMYALNRTGRALLDARIVIVGLAYKPDTGDARESPSVRVLQLLRELGADVVAVDPHVDLDHFPATVELVELTAELAAGADAVVLLTDHRDVDHSVLADHAPYVLDCRRHLAAADNVEHL
ncbi:MAG: nucleotide sugar dehydrogenase [Actinomycetota bacterium]